MRGSLSYVFSQLMQKRKGLANFEFVEAVQFQKAGFVGYKVGGLPVVGAKQKGNVVGIGRIFFQMEKFDFVGRFSYFVDEFFYDFR